MGNAICSALRKVSNKINKTKVLCTENKQKVFFREYEGKEKQPVYQCGEFTSDTKDMSFLTHYIHIVKIDSKQWKNYIDFRDYMNCHDLDAKEYETVKLQAIDKDNKDLHNYHENKNQYVSKMIEKATLWKNQQILVN